MEDIDAAHQAVRDDVLEIVDHADVELVRDARIGIALQRANAEAKVACTRCRLGTVGPQRLHDEVLVAVELVARDASLQGHAREVFDVQGMLAGDRVDPVRLLPVTALSFVEQRAERAELPVRVVREVLKRELQAIVEVDAHRGVEPGVGGVLGLARVAEHRRRQAERRLR
jgi:hypothetical protein